MRDEWKKVTLGDVAFITDGDHLPPPKTDYGIPFIYISNIEGFNKINFTDCSYVPEDYYEKIIDKRKVKENDILYTVVGSYGIPVLVKSETKFCFQRHIALIRAEKINSEFLVQALDSGAFRLQADKVAIGEAQKTVTLDNLRKMRINMPPISEQVKIAETLSIWDSAIAKTEKLISEKEKLYKGHLNYFYVENENCIKLSEFAKEISRRNKNKEVTQVLSVTNKNGFVLPEQQFGKKIASEDLSNYKIVEKGQFAYNPSRINVGSIARLDDFDSAVLSPMYTVFEINTNLINSDYFLHWLLSKYAIHQIKLCAQGGVREIVGFEDFEKMRIKLLSYEKQEKIADLLNLQKSEISLLKKQLEQYKLQKQGLMQKLLTGEWRLK